MQGVGTPMTNGIIKLRNDEIESDRELFILKTKLKQLEDVQPWSDIRVSEFKRKSGNSDYGYQCSAFLQVGLDINESTVTYQGWVKFYFDPHNRVISDYRLSLISDLNESCWNAPEQMIDAFKEALKGLGYYSVDDKVNDFKLVLEEVLKNDTIKKRNLDAQRVAKLGKQGQIFKLVDVKKQWSRGYSFEFKTIPGNQTSVDVELRHGKIMFESIFDLFASSDFEKWLQEDLITAGAIKEDD